MQKMRFIKSATKLSEMPFDHKPEIAFAGRSNAGKSSVINTLAGMRMAKVSSTPGKTRLLNLFDHNEGYRIVDMPGYGYAARSGDEVKSWRKMIESFLLERENLMGILLIMDIRRDWDEEEEMLWELAQQKQLEFGLVLTKIDKLSSSAVMQKKKQLLQQFSIDNCLLVSNTKKTGHKDLEKILFDWVQS